MLKSEARAELTLPFTGPTSYHGCSRADPDGEGPGEQALLLAWGGAFSAEALNDQFSYIQAHIQSFELAHPNILLEYVKGLILWNQSCKISMTWGNSRISERRFGEGSIDDVLEARGLEPDQEHII